jgi:hypothetical protein
VGYKAQCADARAGCKLRCSIVDGGAAGPLFRVSLQPDGEDAKATVCAHPLHLKRPEAAVQSSLE